MMLSGHVVRAQREKLAACMTCPLCNKLFRDATTISECLHTFCRRCIYKKISNEELDSCPVCRTELGCAPLEKLRADHSLQDLRVKIFAGKKEKAMVDEAVSAVQEPLPSAAEVVSPDPLPARRKERSISSLVVSTPKVPAKPFMTGRRLKSIARRVPALREGFSLTDEPAKTVDEIQEGLSSAENPGKIASAKCQNPSTAESSKQPVLDKDTEDTVQPSEGKSDLYTPLNCLLEAANKTKSNKSSSLETLVQERVPAAGECEAQLLKPNFNGHCDQSKINGEANGTTPSSSTSVRSRRLQAMKQKKSSTSEELNVPARAVVDENSKLEGRLRPAWFSLVASTDLEEGASLPQIPSRFLRVKDGNLPVSSIKKYLVHKLGLASDSEVEISLCGHPLRNDLRLQELIDWWLQSIPNSEVHTTVGSSAEDFVMVLMYGRKHQPL